MERRPFRYEDTEDAFFLGVLKITIGVFVGALGALLVHDAITEYRMKLATQDALRDIQVQAERQSANAARREYNIVRMRQEDRDRQEQQRQEQAAAIAEQRAREARKQAAFERFYKPSQACQIDSATMPCANEYMAAKKRFESSYVDR